MNDPHNSNVAGLHRPCARCLAVRAALNAEAEVDARCTIAIMCANCNAGAWIDSGADHESYCGSLSTGPGRSRKLLYCSADLIAGARFLRSGWRTCKLCPACLDNLQVNTARSGTCQLTLEGRVGAPMDATWNASASSKMQRHSRRANKGVGELRPGSAWKLVRTSSWPEQAWRLG
jgi:hypothetical protein